MDAITSIEVVMVTASAKNSDLYSMHYSATELPTSPYTKKLADSLNHYIECLIYKTYEYMNTKIFLGEDDIDDIEIFTDIISEFSGDIKISVAKNGSELMNLLESEKQDPDFIFLDLNMPIKTGFECLKEIKSNEKWNGVKVVILSTSSHREQINEVYQMGADLYLQKPNSYSTFKDILSKCLQMDWDSLKQF